MEETLAAVMGERELEALGSEGEIDTGAEEEWFRREGRQAAARALGRRWEQADGGMPVCGQCGGELRNLGERAKTVHTVCGPVPVRRRVFYCRRCRQTRVPLDKRLGMEGSGLTPGLRRLLCRTALELPYEQSQALLRDTLGFTPCSARELERVAQGHGTRLETPKPAGSAGWRGRAARASKPRYGLAIDGTMIPGLVNEEQHRVEWHEVKIATLFDLRQIESSFYVAGREDADRFGERLWRSLQGGQISPEELGLIVADGAPWIWNLVALHYPQVPQLLDFYHAAEHLHATATAIWRGAAAETWWQRRLHQLREGRIEKFFAALRRLARTHHSADPATSPQRLLQYFQDNRARLGYRWARDQNLPIGSGAVESAARHIVQQRLKQSGMRWSDTGAQAVLNLRTCHRNGDFEQYWENYAASA
jgi:hypothetical protein